MIAVNSATSHGKLEQPRRLLGFSLSHRQHLPEAGGQDEPEWLGFDGENRYVAERE